MIDILRALLAADTDAIAYRVNSDFVTYGALAKLGSGFARLLEKQGTGPVIVYGHKSVDMVISVAACLMAHRAYVPVDVFTPEDRIASIIAQTGTSLVIANEPFPYTCNADVSSLKGLARYESCETKDCGANDIAYIIFTSGSTGDPKGVPISYSNLENFIRWISALGPLREYEGVCVLNQASFSFDLSVADLYYSLFNGHTLVGLDRMSWESPGDMIGVIRENDIAVTVTTPTFMKMCLLNDDFDAVHCPSLRCMYFCGEVLERRTVQKIYDSFPDIRIINAYGPTEATSAVAGILIDRSMLAGEGTLPVGRISSAASEIVIFDGEIILKGASVFSGYLGGAAGGHYTKDGVNCYRTGDRGFIDGDQLYFAGRKDDQIKYKGYRIELGDIESGIRRIDGVTDCAVTARLNDAGMAVTLTAFTVLEDGYDGDYVREELRCILPEYMIPRTIKKVAALPVNPNGKVDRRRLCEL